MDKNSKKYKSLKYIRNTLISLFLCAVFFWVLFANFLGLAVYPGNTYKEMDGKHYLLYAQKFHNYKQDDFLLVKEVGKQPTQLLKATDFTKKQNGQYYIVGKVLLHW